MDAVLVAVGSFVTGFFGGLLGVGGGVFLVPFLVFFGVATPKAAVGLSLASVIATSAASSLISAKSGDARLDLALRLEPPLVLGSVLASVLAARASDGALLFGFAALMIAIAVLVRLRKRFGRTSSTSTAPWSTARTAAVATLALLSGAASGFFGVGGGVLVVPALVLVGRLPLKVAAATSSLCLMTTAAAGVVVHHAHAPIDMSVVAPALVGVVPAGMLGARVQKLLPEAVLEWTFVVLAVAVAVASVLRGMS